MSAFKPDYRNQADINTKMNTLYLCGSFAGLKHKTAKPTITEEYTNI